MGRTPVDKMDDHPAGTACVGKNRQGLPVRGAQQFSDLPGSFLEKRFRSPGELGGSQGRCPVGAYKRVFQGKRKVHATAFNDCRKGGKFLQRHQDSRLRLEETVQLLIRIIGKANERMIGLEERIKRLEEAVAEKSMRQ